MKVLSFFRDVRTFEMTPSTRNELKMMSIQFKSVMQILMSTCARFKSSESRLGAFD